MLVASNSIAYCLVCACAHTRLPAPFNFPRHTNVVPTTCLHDHCVVVNPTRTSRTFTWLLIQRTDVPEHLFRTRLSACGVGSQQVAPSCTSICRRFGILIIRVLSPPWLFLFLLPLYTASSLFPRRQVQLTSRRASAALPPNRWPGSSISVIRHTIRRTAESDLARPQGFATSDH